METLNQITAKQIFEADQVLTLEIAKKLIGKKIAITNPEYKGNSACVRIFTLCSIESEWDLAAKEDMSHTDNGKYPTRQHYWATMTDTHINGFKNNLKLVGENGKTDGIWATCDLTDKWTFNEPTFFGSDADREIYYIILE